MPRGAAKAKAMQRQARIRRRIQYDLRAAAPAEVRPGEAAIRDKINAKDGKPGK